MHEVPHPLFHVRDQSIIDNFRNVPQEVELEDKAALQMHV